MLGEQFVGGLRCGEVLAELSELLDGHLAPARVRQLQEHVRGCERCAAFSVEFSAAVHALRDSLREPESSSELRPEAAERLRSDIKKELARLAG